ncbi:hypothetical protein HOY82DRAFT_617162 [Tuber indicum]|nr:hypothetical protein HOY82DRAFT_617162 [Tuber indicum]
MRKRPRLLLRVTRSAYPIPIDLIGSDKVVEKTCHYQSIEPVISNFKRTGLRQQHQDLTPGPVALAADDKNVEFESGIRRIDTDFPIPWTLGNFASPVDRRECAPQFLIQQMKKVRSDIAVETKRAAKATPAATARAKRRTMPAAPATSTTHTTTIARTPTRTHRSPVAIRSSVAARGCLDPRSSLATRRALTTRKRARIDDEGEVGESLSRLLAKWPKQVELRELRFTSFSDSCCGPDSNRIYPTTYSSVKEFPRLVRNHPNEGSFVGLMVVAVAAEGDMDHRVEDEIGTDYTGEDEDEEELGRGNGCGNLGPEELEDSGEGPSQPSGMPRQTRSTSWGRSIEAGGTTRDEGSGQDSDDGDDGKGGNEGEDSDDGDNGDNGDDNDNDLYSRPIESIIPNGPDRSIPRHIRENNAFEADEDATATAIADPTTISDGALLGRYGDQLNNDFEHQCLKEAARMLGAEPLAPVEDRPPVALIADDMGLGKTHCALATLLYLKYIVDEAASGRTLPCLSGKSVAELEDAEVPWIFGADSEVAQTKWLFTQVTDEGELDSDSLHPLNSVIADVKRENTTLDVACSRIKDISWPWTIWRWGETKDSNRDRLVHISELLQHDVLLQYIDVEASAIDSWIEEAEGDRWNAIQTILHEWCLACLTMDLLDNEVSLDDSESVDVVSYRQNWDRNNSSAGPVFRWLSDVFVPPLLGTPEGGVPNTIVIVTPSPGLASYIDWFFRTVHAGVRPILYHSGVASRDRDRLLQEFTLVDRLAALILTPALAGTGLNLVVANHVVIMQKFWNLNEQHQAVARIHLIRERRTPKAWILHCEGGVTSRTGK